MSRNSYILCFEDFYFEEENFDLNEANQDTVKSLQSAKAHYTKRAQQIQKKQAEAGEVLSKIKDREGKTNDSMTKKIYQARAGEESMKQQLYTTRLEAVKQAAKIVDQKLTVANLRLQAKAKRGAK
jgi:hypothetical protein